MELLGSRAGVYILIAGIALVAAFVVIVLTISLWERLYMAGDVEPASVPYPFPVSQYWVSTRQDALRLEWQHAGDFVTRKDTSAVKGLQSLFVSPDGLVLAAIIAGSAAVGKIKKTVLRSKLADGRILESSDTTGLRDLSGVTEQLILLNAGMDELVGFHQRRILNSGSGALAFRVQAALAEFEQMDLERGARWVNLGLARWANREETILRMTFRGALGHVRNFFRDVREVGRQQHRSHIRRAGSRPEDSVV